MSVSNRYTGGGGRKRGVGGAVRGGGAPSVCIIEADSGSIPFPTSSSRPPHFPFPSPLPLSAALSAAPWGEVAAHGEEVGGRIKLASFTTFPLAGLVKVRGGAANGERAALINFERL